MTLAYALRLYVVELVAGLGVGGVLFLVASGLTLIFGAMRIVNLAHGSLYMVGAYAAASLAGVIGLSNATFWAVLLLAALAVAVGGLVMEVLFLRAIYRRPLLAQLVVTLALSLIIDTVVRRVGHGGPTDAPPFLQGSVGLLGGYVQKADLFAFGVAVAVGLALWGIMSRTALGRMVRAAVSDPVLLGLSGVNVRLVFTGTFVFGAFLAGLAGAIVTFRGFIFPGMAADALILALAVVIIGGLGSLPGAFLAALIVGVGKSVGILWVPWASLPMVFAVLVVVLAVRPQGLMGKES